MVLAEWLVACEREPPGFEVSFGTHAPGTGTTGTPPATPHHPPPPVTTALRPWLGEWIEPARVALDPDRGHVLVADPRGGAIVVRRRDGSPLRVARVGGRPLSVAIDARGRVWVGDAGGAIRVYDEDWVEVRALTGPVRPVDLAVHRGLGRVFVADAGADALRVYDLDGNAVGTWGVGRLREPGGVAVDTRTVWVSSQDTHEVVAFDLQGGEVGAFGVHGEEPGELYTPQGLALDDVGRLWVADVRLGRVSAFDTDGTFLGSVGSVGTGPAQLLAPTDVVVDAAGRLAVASSGSGRLAWFGIDAFDDLQRYQVAEVSLHPREWTPDTASVTARVQIEGADVAELVDLAANGVSPLDLAVGDRDGDGRPDLTATFDGAALRATVAPGRARVVVTGRLPDLAIREPVAVTVLAGPTPRATGAPGIALAPPRRGLGGRPPVRGAAPRAAPGEAEAVPADREPSPFARAGVADTGHTGTDPARGCAHGGAPAVPALLVGLSALRRRRSP